MKAICLKDYKDLPYATWVEQGIKNIETRKWKPKRWPVELLICCSKSSKSPNAGLALCVVELYVVDKMYPCHEERACCKVYRRRNGRPAWSWFFRNRRLLSEKFPVKGKLSIFDVQIPEGIELIPVPDTHPEYVVNFKQIEMFPEALTELI